MSFISCIKVENCTSNEIDDINTLLAKKNINWRIVETKRDLFSLPTQSNITYNSLSTSGPKITNPPTNNLFSSSLFPSTHKPALPSIPTPIKVTTPSLQPNRLFYSQLPDKRKESASPTVSLSSSYEEENEKENNNVKNAGEGPNKKVNKRASGLPDLYFCYFLPEFAQIFGQNGQKQGIFGL